uniref:IgG receptor FcRn large subunit p51 n=1 Tax=Oryctolagus cuniculus TaxID=9986 RepID=A0A5F9CH64_RABIT
MGRPRLLPGALRLLLCLLPGTLAAGSHLSLLYHITAVTDPHGGTPSFFVSWYWEKETVDLKNKQQLFLEALEVLGEGSYTLQGLLGCELGPDNASVPTAKFALNGEDFMSFDPKQGSWAGEWPEALRISTRWQQQAEAVSKERTFLLTSCPQRLLGHLERGRGNLEWKEPPSMRLKARPGSPGFSVLTCSAFSFYPPELQFGFLRNGMAAGSGEGGFGPNGDGSFYAWASLSVRSGDEYRYSCVVRHAGLPQPLSVALGEVPRLAFLPTPRARSCHSAGAWPPASEALPPQASCRPRLPAAPGSLPLLPPAPPRPVLPAPACLPSCCRRPAPTLIAPCLLLAPRDPPPRPQPRALGHRPPALPLPRAARAWEGPGAPQLPEAAHGLLPCRLATPSPR